MERDYPSDDRRVCGRPDVHQPHWWPLNSSDPQWWCSGKKTKAS